MFEPVEKNVVSSQTIHTYKPWRPSWVVIFKKVQVGKDQKKGQSEKDSHSKNGGGREPN